MIYFILFLRTAGNVLGVSEDLLMVIFFLYTNLLLAGRMPPSLFWSRIHVVRDRFLGIRVGFVLQ